jgi:hypothetical protein
MLNSLRRTTAAVCLVALVAGTTIPLSASAERERSHSSILNSSDSEANNMTTPVMVDVLILRPIGLGAMALAAVLFVVPVVPLTLLTRPSEMGRPWRRMIIAPARFVWADPLGSH